MTERGAQQITNLAAQWDARQETETLTLPSGNKIVVSDPDLPTLALHGHIPNHLLPIVEKFIFDEQQAMDAINADEQEPGERLKRMAEFQQYLDCFTVAASVDPRVTFDGANGTLNVKKLSVAEKTHIWRWSAGLLTPLSEFPRDGDGALRLVPDAPDGEDLRDAPERAPGSDE